MLDRIAYLETALNNYGSQLRAINEAVSCLQLSANAIPAPPLAPATNATEALLKSRRLFQPKARLGLSTELPPAVNSSSFKQQLEKLKLLNYGVYDEWFNLLEPNLVSYRENPEAGISVEENAGARLFRDFIAPYAQGSVLDIGCGIAPLPAYLSDFELDLVAGSDPLSPELHREFSFHHGLAELLPWKDSSFDNVIIGTSMDHFLDPYRALEEAKRVLKPNGYLLLWMGFIPKSEKYDPMKANLKPVDEFHLFHFDKEWFEPVLEDNYIVSEYIPINEVSSFYACTPLKNN